MRTRKRVIVFVLLLATVLASVTGCGDSSGKKGGDSGGDSPDSGLIRAGTGRFMEEEVTLPGGIRDIKAIRKLSDGSLEVIGKADREENCYLLVSKDGGNKWVETKIQGLGKDYCPLTAIAPDGTAVLLSYMKEGAVSAKITDTKGQTKDFSFSLPDGSSGDKDNQIVQAVYDAEGKLVVLDMYGSLYEVAADGSCQRQYDTRGIGIRHFSIAEQILYAVHEDGVLLFDTGKKESLAAESVLDSLVKGKQELVQNDTDRGQPLLVCAGTEKDAVVLAWKEGIFHFGRGGSVVEQLADESQTSFGGGELMLLGMAVMDAENIFLAVSEGGGDKLYHYAYDKAAAAVPEKELSVYALDDSAFLRQAVKLFQKNNPDIHVKLEFGLSGQDGVTLEDALSTLNTSLLAKKGPDVLILDGMPADSYIEKGILCDLTELVDEIDKKDGIFPGIREGSKKDGKIYAMPARFLISIVEGDKGTVASGGTLPALAKRAAELKGKNKSASVIRKGSRTLLRDLYYADSATWQKEDGTLDENALKEYLACAKQMYDLDPVDKEDDFRDREVGDGTFDGEKIGTSESAGLISKEIQISFGSMAGIHDLQTICSTEVKTKADYCLMNGDKVRSYIPYLMAGVVEGDNAETAKAFVRELLGRKAGSNASNGIPVNRAAYDAVCKEKLDSQDVKDDVSLGFSNEEGEEFSFDYVNLTKENEDKFTKIVESLTRPSLTSRIIQELVLEQGEKYLLGEQSLESAMEAIEKKVNLYLSE